MFDGMNVGHQVQLGVFVLLQNELDGSIGATVTRMTQTVKDSLYTRWIRINHFRFEIVVPSSRQRVVDPMVDSGSLLQQLLLLQLPSTVLPTQLPSLQPNWYHMYCSSWTTPE